MKTLTPLLPGVPDMHSLKSAIERGYTAHADGLWWPVYGRPGHYVSPDGKRAKFVLADVNKRNWAWNHA